MLKLSNFREATLNLALQAYTVRERPIHRNEIHPKFKISVSESTYHTGNSIKGGNRVGIIGFRLDQDSSKI